MATAQEARRQEVLSNAALVLASALSLPAVLQKIVELAAEITDARYGALGVLGPDGRISEFVTSGISERGRAAIGHLPEGLGILGALIDDARPLRLARLQDDPRSVGFPAHHPPMTTFLGAPIAVRGTVFGNLYLTEKRGGGEFTAEDEDAVVKLAVHAAVAIENARLYQQAEMGRRRLTAVNEITQAILSGAGSEQLLRMIAWHARELVSARVASIAMPAGDERFVVRVAVGDGADGLEGAVFPAASSVSGEVVATGHAILVRDAASDPRVHQPLVKAGNMGPAVFVPLAVGRDVVGTLAIANAPGASEFSEGDVEVIRLFAAQASVALEHARIREELQRLAVVEDRERIAKELHDDIIQSLFAEGMALQAALSTADDPAATRTRIGQAVENLDRVIRDLRNYIFGLRPGAAADQQLDRSLRDLAASFREGAGMSIEVATDSDAVSRLAPRAPDVLQAAREALSNAVRHSGAETVTIAVMSAGDTAILEIADDGRGFDPAAAQGRGHGLANMRARAEALGGDLDIESVPGRGTWVRFHIPV